MTRLILTSFLTAFTMIVAIPKIQAEANDASYDIVVYGGTSSGVIAAYSARQLGKTVLLIEPGFRLGGLSTGGLGQTDIGNKYAITGLGRDFYRRLGRHYGKLEAWKFEPKAALDVFEDYIQEADVEVLFDHRLIGAQKEGSRIVGIHLEQSSDPERSRLIRGKMFIDCTYEGDLMAAAGVSYTVGRESNDLYGETINGVQFGEKHQFPDGIDPYRVEGDPSSGLVWGVSNAKLGKNGTGDRLVQAYNFRTCLTDVEDNLLPIEKPKGYDPATYELLLRLIREIDSKSIKNHFLWNMMPNRKTDINNKGGFSTDMIGANHEYPEADFEKRAEIIQAHKDYTLGLFYFLGNDPRVPEEIRAEILRWGLPKDEYIDDGHFSPQLYVREARRMVGEYVMTEANCIGERVVSDGIAMAAYTMDSHNCQRIIVNGMVKNEGDVQQGGFPPYEISYLSLTPKSNECENLVVPVCLSASHIAFGSIRMEPVFMVLGQVAAMASAQAIEEDTPVQSIDVNQLQNHLARDPFLDGSIPEIFLDNSITPERVKVLGDWQTMPRNWASNANGPDLLVHHSPTQNDSVTFLPEIAYAAEYKLYVYSSSLRQYVENDFSKLASHGRCKVVVNGELMKVVEYEIDHMISDWVEIGSYEWVPGDLIEISFSSADTGMYGVDAILCL